jgi:hypothetical protein
MKKYCKMLCVILCLVHLSFAFTNRYSEDIIEKIKLIDYSMLDSIFSEAKEAGFVTDEFLQAILDRRDQVLDHYNRLG